MGGPGGPGRNPGGGMPAGGMPGRNPGGGMPGRNPGGGPPGGQVRCPDNVCRDYNFKVNGCERGNACQKDHKCPQCGRAHPYRGNH